MLQINPLFPFFDIFSGTHVRTGSYAPVAAMAFSKMKATGQYFPTDAVYYAGQGSSSFWSSDEILKRNHSNESFWAELSCGAVQSGFNVWVRGMSASLSKALEKVESLENGNRNS